MCCAASNNMHYPSSVQYQVLQPGHDINQLSRHTTLYLYLAQIAHYH